MPSFWRFTAAALLGVALAGRWGAPPARAAPPRQGEAAGLQNTDLEGEGTWAPWQTWSVVNSADCKYQAPTISGNTLNGDDTLHVLSAHQSIKITVNGQNSYWAGLYQTVSGGRIRPGVRLRFSAWAQMDANSGYDPTPSNLAGVANMQVGIDPTGGTSPTSSSIVWSPPENRFDQWYEIVVEATAQANSITVFLSAHPTACNENNSTYFDATSLLAVGSGPTSTPLPAASATAPASTQPPSAAPTTPPTVVSGPRYIVTPTPDSDGAIVYVVQPGDTLLGIALAAGTTVEQLQTLNGLSDTNIIIGQRLILRPAVTATLEVSLEEPTAGASPPPAPTAPAIAEAPHDTGAGKVCLMMFADANGDGRRDAGEPPLAGGGFRLTDSASRALVGEYRTDAIDEPHCFENLAPGTYLIEASGPDGYELTTIATAGALLPPRSVVNLEFGARAESSFAELRFGVVVSIVGVLLVAGAAGFFVYRRRAN